MRRVSFLATVLLATSCFSASAELSENQLDQGKVKAGGKPVTLLGSGIKIGDQAPNFKVVNADFTPVSLSDFDGKAVLISVVPSLDTGICSLQTKYFNEKVASEYPEVVMLTISTDLPFAQKRFCKQEGVDKVQTLSDSVWRNFGEQYGLLIKDMGLLSRAVFVLDKSHKVQYKQLVDNLATEPDYAAAIASLKAL
ncbi:lipid hydroperoxide peroxidase [Pseudoalteromonas luteoviolacea]|uniref:Lipid hydroperoxide peroxidase n=1 Tax=Pseudoalteromonas luteoviolacea TaxID=43657 RepID=A0A1C0TSX3_9GAMM|nr:thiol peroxidase [Pseudoalteromonas luteoviolacea]OCQ22429.1 lipid hydroperoxide peroxidase [Pseudoalteromonas luteoviolacea]